MKAKSLFTIMLSSLLLASCQNSNTEDYTNDIIDESNTLNDELTTNNANENQKKINMTYQEYVGKYEKEKHQQNEPSNDYTDSGDNKTTSSEINNNSYNNGQENNNVPTDSNSMLATFSTPLISSSDARNNNLEIVCDRLNNFILKPNETFSYNDTTGPFGKDDGFEKAPILLKNGEHTDGYGGRSLPTKHHTL